jgi:hypothetical protein
MCYQPPGTGICVTFSHLWWGDASITPPSFFLCAPVAHHRPPPVRTVLRSCLWPTNDAELFPSPHLSSHTHTWLRSASYCARTRATVAPPPLSRCRPPSGVCLATTLPQSEPRWAQSKVPLACLPARPHLAGGELAPPSRAHVWRQKPCNDPCASLKGIFMNFQIFLGAMLEVDS